MAPISENLHTHTYVCIYIHIHIYVHAYVLGNDSNLIVTFMVRLSKMIVAAVHDEDIVPQTKLVQTWYLLVLSITWKNILFS